MALAALPVALAVQTDALAASPHVLSEGSQRVEVGSELEVLEDPSRQLSFEQLRGRDFEPAERVPNFGFSSSVYWFRFALHSEFASNTEWLLEVESPLIDDIQLYVEQADDTWTHITAGDKREFSARPIPHSNFVFPITALPGVVQHVYIRVETGSRVQLPMTLWRPEAFRADDRNRSIGWGLYYGAMLVMILYNLFIYFTVRHRSYLFYCAYVCSLILWQVSMQGLGYQYLWPNSPGWQDKSVAFLIAQTCALAGLFCREFLELSSRHRRWNRVILGQISVTLAITALSLFLPYGKIISPTVVMAIVTALLLASTGLMSWRSGNKVARFFVLAWAVFLTGVVVISLAGFGLLPRNFLTENGHRIGSLLEVVFLSFALADRINAMRREKESIQRQAAENLQREVDRQTCELREQAEKLKELDRVKTRFFSNVSHEFRTPLTLTIGPLEALVAGKAGTLTAEQHSEIEVCLRNSRRLLRLINHLLDLTRLDAGRMAASYRPRELGAFANGVAVAFSTFASSKGLALSCECEQPITAYIDPDKMDRVLFNLVSNACKFTRPGGQVNLRVRRGTDRDRPIEIEVQDTGVGIAAEELPHIFDRFRQADSSSTREYEGSGLGLALAREIVELHGGRLSAESQQGIGTTLTVALREGKDHLDPAAVHEDEAVEDFVADRAALELAVLEAKASAGKRARAPADDSDRSVARRDRRVLVVDDNPDMLRHVASVLSAYEVSTATNGREALELVAASPPHLIVTDVMMPEVDGHELCARVKNDPATAHIPVILLTAQAGLEQKLEGLAARADDYVTKPFSPDELVARVGNLLLAQAQSEALRDLNRELERRVLEQADELSRRSRLSRYLPPRFAEMLLEGEASLEPSQRFVAVLRLEMHGTSALGVSLEADAVAALVGQFQTLATEAIFAQAGVVLSLHQGELQALFGALPTGDEEAVASAALRATEELLSALDRATPAWRDLLGNQTLAVRGGLDCGTATVGELSSADWAFFSAVGEPVARAELLCGYAVPGEVFASARLVRWAKRIDAFDAPRAIDLGGTTVEVHDLPVPESLVEISNLAPSVEETISATSKTLVESSATSGDAGEEVPLFAEGIELGDRFRVTRLIGRGGTGAVYEVEDMVLGEPVALKVLKTRSKSAFERLRREVRLARLISHPNVCRVFDLHVVEGAQAVTMELIRGVWMRAHLGRQALDLDRILRWGIAMCEGLRAAHACAVIHRDLKPENVLVEDTGRVVLADFGIARSFSHALGEKFEGTLDYVAPEQLMQNRGDARSDIYALGVVLFEMATGRRPFLGETALARAMARTTDVPLDPSELTPDLPDALRAVILRCLEREPERRFQRAADLADALERLAFRHGCAWRELIPVPRPARHERGAVATERDARARGR